MKQERTVYRPWCARRRPEVAVLFSAIRSKEGRAKEPTWQYWACLGIALSIKRRS